MNLLSSQSHTAFSFSLSCSLCGRATVASAVPEVDRTGWGCWPMNSSLQGLPGCFIACQDPFSFLSSALACVRPPSHSVCVYVHNEYALFNFHIFVFWFFFSTPAKPFISYHPSIVCPSLCRFVDLCSRLHFSFIHLLAGKQRSFLFVKNKNDPPLLFLFVKNKNNKGGVKTTFLMSMQMHVLAFVQLPTRTDHCWIAFGQRQMTIHHLVCPLWYHKGEMPVWFFLSY